MQKNKKKITIKSTKIPLNMNAEMKVCKNLSAFVFDNRNLEFYGRRYLFCTRLAGMKQNVLGIVLKSFEKPFSRLS